MEISELHSLEYFDLRNGIKGNRLLGLILVVSVINAILIFYFYPGYYALLMNLILLLVVACWYRPIFGFYVLFGLTLFFEQFDFAPFQPITRQVPFFENLNISTSLSFLILNPLEIMLVSIIVIWLIKLIGDRDSHWHKNALFMPLSLFLGSLFFFAVFGLFNGGEWNVSLWELRALIYLSIVIFLLPNLLSTAGEVKALLWIAILFMGIKAFQGIWHYVVVFGGDLSQVRAITAHEDALFFGSLFIFLLAMSIFDGPRIQKITLSLLSPAMLFTFVATNRRVAYVALGVGLVVFFFLSWTQKNRRRILLALGLPSLLLFAVYLPFFWNSLGLLGRPAQAIKSIWYPAATADIQSNMYRQVEEMSLRNTLKQNPILGTGFGKPYGPMGQLDRIGFSLQDYIPHNEILWLWVKTGTVGFIIFWLLIGSIIVKGCSIFKKVSSPYLKAIALTTVALIIMQMVVSYADLQLTFYRNMIYMGTFVGILLKLEDFDQRSEAVLPNV